MERIYDTAEDVLNQYLDKGDIFIRYKDDTYIIIFAHADAAESRLKAALIAEDIRKRLFALDEDELLDIEIRQAIGEIRHNMLMDASFPDDMFSLMDQTIGDWDQDGNPEMTAPQETSLDGVTIEDNTTKDDSSPDEETSDEIALKERELDLSSIEMAEVESDPNAAPRGDATTISVEAVAAIPDHLDCAYMPLWDTQKGALTTYLCLAGRAGQSESALKTHSHYYKNKTPAEKAALDIALLNNINAQLAAMAADGRRFLMVCPVHHSTLFRTQSFEIYKERLETIPQDYRRYVMLLVLAPETEAPPSKKSYWFALPLRQFCPFVFIELPLRTDLNFLPLAESGINSVGVLLGKDERSEQEIIHNLGIFCGRAKSQRISKSFVLDVNSLSLTTSAVCAGFDFIGGPAIHTTVEQPDTVHRYQYGDLLSSLKS